MTATGSCALASLERNSLRSSSFEERQPKGLETPCTGSSKQLAPVVVGHSSRSRRWCVRGRAYRTAHQGNQRLSVRLQAVE